jgi:hypothetical protein
MADPDNRPPWQGCFLEEFGDHYKTMVPFGEAGYARILEYKPECGAGANKFCVYVGGSGGDGDPIDLTEGEVQMIVMLLQAVLKDSAQRDELP